MDKQVIPALQTPKAFMASTGASEYLVKRMEELGLIEVIHLGGTSKLINHALLFQKCLDQKIDLQALINQQIKKAS